MTISTSKIKLYSIDLRITSICNLECPFCFGTKCDSPKSIDYNHALSILEEIYDLGVSRVVITGGEPLLNKNLLKILEKCRLLGVYTVLSTNGTLLLEQDLSFFRNVDCLSLPLDSLDNIVLNEMRGISIEAALRPLEKLKEIKAYNPHIKIKVGTVLCNKNRHEINTIKNYILKNGYVDHWKVYQLENNHSEFFKPNRISNSEFSDITETIKRDVRNRIGFSTYRRDRRQGAYLFCEPNADAIAINHNGEIKIGNFRTNKEELLIRINKFIDFSRNMANFQNTYGEILN